MTPAEKQEVIWMFLDQGLSYKEIAERTGIPYGTVYMHQLPVQANVLYKLRIPLYLVQDYLLFGNMLFYHLHNMDNLCCNKS
jgi:hypothetical protein